MTDKTIVILLEENSSSYGNVNDFDQPQDAERYIEGLLEAGYDRERIRVMEAHGLNVEITPKPVVVLHTASPGEETPTQGKPAEDTPTQKKPVEDVRADSRAMELAGDL